MPIKQIVYLSKETEPFDQERLAALVRNCQTKNEARDISGVLLHAPGLFAQCIEGESEEIDRLYDTIRADDRHFDVVKLQDTAISNRCFGEWSMGCCAVEKSDLLKLQEAQWHSAMDEHKDRSWVSPGFVLMEALWRMHGGESAAR